MVSAGPIRAKRERCQPFQDGSPLEGITGADAGDAGPDGALSRPHRLGAAVSLGCICLAVGPVSGHGTGK